MILLSGYLWEVPVSGGRWAGHPGQHKGALTVQPDTESFQAQAQSAGKTRPITHHQTTRNVSSFIHSLSFQAILASLCVTGRERFTLLLPECPVLSSLCAVVTFQRLCCDHSYQINLLEIHLTPSCEQKVALPKHHTHCRANREPAANGKFCLYIHKIR